MQTFYFRRGRPPCRTHFHGVQLVQEGYCSSYIIMIFFHQDYLYINGTFTGFLSEENDFLKMTENAENAFCRPVTWYTLVTMIEIT